jgi:hypothetical protein
MGWGLRPKAVHWLYVTIIRPTVSFASLVWWSGCQMASSKNKLSKVDGQLDDGDIDPMDHLGA